MENSTVYARLPPPAWDTLRKVINKKVKSIPHEHKTYFVDCSADHFICIGSCQRLPGLSFSVSVPMVLHSIRAVSSLPSIISPKEGGGRLVFYVGRYLTGSIHMRSNVSIHLNEGAILVGSLNPFDYDKNGWTALIFARDIKNIAITGLGVIDGQGRQLAFIVVDVIQKGLRKMASGSTGPKPDAASLFFSSAGQQVSA